MKKISLYSMVFLLAALCLLLPLRSFAANKMWWSTCLTGGTAGCLDSLDGDDLTDGDAAFVVRDNTGTYEIYFYRLEDTAGASEASPTTILPDTNPGNKSWKLLTLYGSMILPTAPPTASTEGVMVTGNTGASRFIESSTNCFLSANGAGETFECKTAENAWLAIYGYLFDGTFEDDDFVVCTETTGGVKKIKQCGVKVTYNEPGADAIICRTATSTTGECDANTDIGSATKEMGDVYLKDGAVIKGQADQSNTMTSSSTGWSVNLPFGLFSANDPDVAAEGKITWDANGDYMRGHDGTRQVAIARVQEEIHVTVVKPQDMADAVRDAFLVWSNESGMSFMVTGWKCWAGADNTSLNIETTAADGSGNATVDAVECATGSGPYTGTDTTITAATIANGSLIWLDFDDTDDPSYVKLVIYGYYDANVN